MPSGLREHREAVGMEANRFGLSAHAESVPGRIRAITEALLAACQVVWQKNFTL
jgi:hypothetical protein